MLYAFWNGPRNVANTFPVFGNHPANFQILLSTPSLHSAEPIPSKIGDEVSDSFLVPHHRICQKSDSVQFLTAHTSAQSAPRCPRPRPVAAAAQLHHRLYPRFPLLNSGCVLFISVESCPTLDAGKSFWNHLIPKATVLHHQTRTMASRDGELCVKCSHCRKILIRPSELPSACIQHVFEETNALATISVTFVDIFTHQDFDEEPELEWLFKNLKVYMEMGILSEYSNEQTAYRLFFKCMNCEIGAAAFAVITWQEASHTAYEFMETTFSVHLHEDHIFTARDWR